MGAAGPDTQANDGSRPVVDIESVVQRIDADFAHAELGQVGISFIGDAEWTPGLGGDHIPPAGGEEDLVCVAGGRSFPVTTAHGVEHAIAVIASALQDEVMDHVNRAWPYVEARDLVLEPRVDEVGLAVWSSKDGILRCPVGYLASSLGVLGQVV